MNLTVLTGTVDFSIIITSFCNYIFEKYSAIDLIASSMYFKSKAKSYPTPYYLVGVFLLNLFF